MRCLIAGIVLFSLSASLAGAEKFTCELEPTRKNPEKQGAIASGELTVYFYRIAGKKVDQALLVELKNNSGEYSPVLYHCVEQCSWSGFSGSSISIVEAFPDPFAPERIVIADQLESSSGTLRLSEYIVSACDPLD